MFVNDKENVAAKLLGAGWARVRAPGGQQSPYYDDLAKAAGEAEARGLGVHTKDADVLAAAVRDVLTADGGRGVVAGGGLRRGAEKVW